MNAQAESYEPEVFTLDGIVQSVLEFEDLVKQKSADLNLPPQSSIEAAGLTAIGMLETFKGAVRSELMQNNRIEWRKAVAVGDMLRKVLQARKHPRFDQLWPHILLLLGNTNIALNVWNPKEDQEANKIFELYMALVLAPLCPDLEPEDPKLSAGGKNPDLIASLDGERWAFACKVMHSDSPKTFLDRVYEGVKQIERSDASKGIVVISLKNLLPHDDYWASKRPQTGFADFLVPGLVDTAIVARKLQEYCARCHHRVVTELLGGPAAFNDIFKNSKAVPAVLLHLCTTVLVPNDGKPNFRLMRMFGVLTHDPLPAQLTGTLEKLNRSLHGRIATANS